MPPLVTSTLGQGHERIDARSLAMHRAIAVKLRAAPELLAIAYDNLRRWSESAGRSQPYLDAWMEVLARPFEEMLALIQEENESMHELRTADADAVELEGRWAGR